MTESKICTCPSGDGSLAHPCPAHPAVEQAGGDERDVQGAQGERDGWGPLPIVQVPWNVFDRAVMWVEDRRRYGDDGTIVDDWKALKTIQRAALAQPSPAPADEKPGDSILCSGCFAKGVGPEHFDEAGKCLVRQQTEPLGAEFAQVLSDNLPELLSTAQAEQAEAERPPQPERYTADVFHPERPYYMAQTSVVRASDFDEFATQYERIVGALRFERQQMDRAFTACINERDAALARVAELTATRNRYGVDAHYFNKNLQRILRDFESFTPDELARSLIILAKVADEKVVAQHSVLEKQEPVATIAKVPGEDWNGLHFYRDLQGMQPGTKLYAAPVAQAQPEETPGEILAAKLIETWVTKHGKPAPWSTAVEITAVATNMPNDERERLLALDDDVDAQAQHSVPEGWMLVECGIWTQEQVDEMQKTVARFRNSEFVDDRALAMAVADAGQCKAPEISLAELLAAEAQALRDERDSQQRVAIKAMEELAALHARVVVLPDASTVYAALDARERLFTSPENIQVALEAQSRLNGMTVSESALDTLRKAASGEVKHLNNGLCPDDIEGHEARDPDCPVCRALIETGKESDNV
ncbi:hypothetical protein OLM81_02100 [Pseudomonas aeruginosa]|uniref:hypothetical protein n=1 Tax=Pseudomonas aeruginosa TaxID=287 RepID=UPI0024965331|nr:hypothetical protein [Pseudomonas aeruginosa]MDI2373556.1 hypothetical protein [Pseudomonas aeruginosa]MDI2379490.1 hypothetical protein [Pseudomonas aeruginosa]